jgi:hypothetical protein
MKNILFEQITRSKNLMGITEADISGIDELVYNPVTGKGGSVGYGYNDGKKVNGITWTGHDNHLHIGFTDKKVAMEVIDKADSMGLKTTENPYSKKDPNNVVDTVHTSKSLHYKNFDGDPIVGKAVDISGDKNQISELIKWINQKYAGESTELPQSTTTTTSPEQVVSNKEDVNAAVNKLINSELDGVKIADIIKQNQNEVNSFFEDLASKSY